jgi:hypothetical protein
MDAVTDFGKRDSGFLEPAKRMLDEVLAYFILGINSIF